MKVSGVVLFDAITSLEAGPQRLPSGLSLMLPMFAWPGGLQKIAPGSRRKTRPRLHVYRGIGL